MTERLPANFKDFTRKGRARCCAAHRYYANPWNFLASKTLKDNNGAGSSSGGGVGTCGTNSEIVDVQRSSSSSSGCNVNRNCVMSVALRRTKHPNAKSVQSGSASRAHRAERNCICFSVKSALRP